MNQKSNQIIKQLEKINESVSTGGGGLQLVDIDKINGTNVKVGEGVGTNALRVIPSNDSFTGVMLSRIGGTLGDVVSGSNIAVNNGVMSDGTQRVCIASDNPSINTSVINYPTSQTIDVADDGIDVNIIQDNHDTELIFNKYFDIDTDNDNWIYNLSSGSGIAETFNAYGTLDITTTALTQGTFYMTSVEDVNLNNLHTTIYMTLTHSNPEISTISGSNVSTRFGIMDENNQNGFYISKATGGNLATNIHSNGIRVIQTYDYDWNPGVSSLPYTIDWGKEQTYIIELSNSAVKWGVMYQGKNYFFHCDSLENSQNLKPSVLTLPIYIRVSSAVDGDLSYTTSIRTVKITRAMKHLETKSLLSTHLKDGATFDAIGDYSLSATDFKYVASATCYISRLIVFIEDATAFDADEYGAITGGLTNGIKIYTQTASGIRTPINNDIPIHTNAEWSHLCFDKNYTDYGGNKFLVVRFSFSKMTEILLNKNDEIGVTLEDDFTPLIHHYFTIQGFTI